MVRVVLFGLFFAVGTLAGAADKSPAGEKTAKAEKGDTAAQAPGPAKPAKPDTSVKVAKPGKTTKAEKPDTADPAAKGAKAPPVTSDPQSTYESLLREHGRLERQKKILEWEEGLAAASLADSAAYLVIDLERQVITAKLGGVPMRDAPILSRYERPGQQPVAGIFLVAEKKTEAPPSLADSAKVAIVGADSAKGDSAKIDTSLARILGTHRGPAPRRYDPQKRYCITLQGGPDLWLATPPSAETRMDSLELRVQLWLRDFPAVVQHRRSIHLFLAPADNHWIYAMAVLGARVLVIPPS